MRLLTRGEQRRRDSLATRASITLELQLRELIRSALHDKELSPAALVSFQQMIQYAPTEMKIRLESYITSLRGV